MDCYPAPAAIAAVRSARQASIECPIIAAAAARPGTIDHPTIHRAVGTDVTIANQPNRVF
jgi:hypothetical protein